MHSILLYPLPGRRLPLSAPATRRPAAANTRTRSLLAVLLLAGARVAMAAEPASTAVSDTCKAVVDEADQDAALNALAARDLPVGEISVRIDPVFDESKPEENNWLFRWVNRLHIPPEEKTIREDLLFGTGERFSVHAVQESERLLRTRRYLRNARIVPVGDCADAADLQVQVQGVWTLLPDVSFSRKGGRNSSRLGFRDTNFLGSGREVIVVRESDDERSGLSVNYKDPNLGHSRAVLDAEYTDNNDGEVHRLALYRPFFALETPWAGGIYSDHSDAERDRYFRGEEVQTWRARLDRNTIFGGWSAGLVDGVTTRWQFGFTDQRWRFVDGADPLLNGPLPEDRHHSWLWLDWQRIEDRYVKVSNVNQIRRTEDINLGWQTRLTLGRSAHTFGADDEAWIFAAELARTQILSERQLLSYSWRVDGLYGEQGLENTLQQFDLRWHYGDFDSTQTFVGLSLTHGRALYRDTLLEAGGDEILRGYPLHYQSGSRRALLTLERRWYFNREWFSLFHLGAVAFFDAGRAWTPGIDNGVNGGWLQNVGLGLRLSPTRTGSDSPGKHTVLHIDVAKPLVRDGDDELDDYQWLLSIQNSF